MKKGFCVLFILIIIFSFGIQAQNDRLEKLEQVIQKQARQIKNLQTRLETIQDTKSYKDYTEKIVKEYLQQPLAEEDQTGITAGYEDSFFINAADGNLRLEMRGFVQAGAGIVENNTDENNSFFLNGAELSFEVYIFKDWHARIQVDFAEPESYQFQDGTDYEPDLKDAYIEYIGIPEFNVRIGKTHVPFTIEGQYSKTGAITIWSAPFINAWAHGRDVGLVLHGVLSNMVGYKFGIFNGEGSSTNLSDDMLMAGQIRFYYCGHDTNPENFFHVGILRNRGENNKTLSLTAPWGLGLLNTIINDHQTAVDIGAKWQKDLEGGHAVRVETEFMYSTWERHFDSIGIYAANMDGYGFLFAASYRHCLDPEIEGSGVIGLFKFSYTEFDNEDTRRSASSISNTDGQEVHVYTLGLGYAFNKHVVAQINWVMMDVLNRFNGSATGKSDESGGLAHAWFFQVTTEW